MKSKSKTRFKDAITTMKSDINMLVIDPFKGFKISKLKHIKENSGQADTIGLSEEVIKTCLETFEDLNKNLLN